jgi:hypothetical protein
MIFLLLMLQFLNTSSHVELVYGLNWHTKSHAILVEHHQVYVCIVTKDLFGHDEKLVYFE